MPCGVKPVGCCSSPCCARERECAGRPGTDDLHDAGRRTVRCSWSIATRVGRSMLSSGSPRLHVERAMWDAIVIGSGISGLGCAAALSKRKRRVLVLEQHSVAGGLTQTFRRQNWEFAPGVHYIAGVGPQPGPDSQFGRLLAWLSDGTLRFAAGANPYDIVRLPGFEFGIAHPEQAYRDALEARFPRQRASIAHWFEACAEARRSAYTLFALRGMPSWMAWGVRLLRGAEAQRWSQRTLADELARIDDDALRVVLGGRWADYGATHRGAAPVPSRFGGSAGMSAGRVLWASGPVLRARASAPFQMREAVYVGGQS